MSRLRLTKIATPGSPPSGKTELFYSTADSKLEAVDENGALAILGGFAVKDYRLVKVVAIFQGTTTYTPSAGVKALYVEAVGGGGAGGGAATTSTGQGSIGGGGGAGGYSAEWVTGAAVKSSYTVQVGAGGTGVSGTTGNGGTDTTFDSPSVCTAKGGSGGSASAAITASGTTAQGGGNGGSAASGVGDVAMGGSDGAWGYWSNGPVLVGWGGPSPLGSGTTWGWGAVGKPYGGGGGGHYNTASSSARAGGAGANGLIRVWEFA